MDNKQPSVADVVRHLTQLRDVHAHRLKTPGLPADVFNESRRHLNELNEQLKTLNVPGVEVPAIARVPAQRIKVKQNFTARIMRKVGVKK